MDKERRNNLRRVINQCRMILENDITKRIAYYGLQQKAFLDVSKLTHLRQEDLAIRNRLEHAIEKEKLGGLSISEAIVRYIRHVGFTYLNRLAALRAMEVRGLVKETVIRRDKYGGRSLREMEIGEKNPSLTPDQVLKGNLLEAFQEVSKEIKVLFDVDNEYILVFPETRACLEVIKLLTEDVTEDDWKQDDIIGWIYQYYNEEARREYRKAKSKPKSDDIPIINQFYTPHWIVKTLVDNTLGRLWIEMHSNSKIKELCSYLVPLKSGSPKREVKSVRDIKILDPACGSGHFLVYAFDILYQMYLEEEPATPLSEIPILILENNLFGIDIDLRAVQLAALSLYLKAKTYEPSLEIRKMNLVCADIRISDGTRRSEFLERFKDDVDLQRIFARLFEDLSNTYEIGSLLKVRQPFERLFGKRKSPRLDRQAKFSYSISGQTQLSEKGLIGQTEFLFDSSSSSSNSSETKLVMYTLKERTIEQMLEELRKFEREAFEVHDMGRLLFATETEKSIGLLDLLSQKYDIVVMNPPYGDMPSKTKKYLKKYYPETHFDYYAAFIEQATDLALDEGFIGALTGKTFMFLKWFQWIREKLLKEKASLQLVLDLDFGVLDVATIRWAAFTAQKISNKMKQSTLFIRLSELKSEAEKKTLWEEIIKSIKSNESHYLAYQRSLEEFSKILGTPFSYWASDTLRDLFIQFPPLDRDVAKQPNRTKIADVNQGLATADDLRFTRYWWEIAPEEITTNREHTFQGKKWVPFAKGGAPFFHDIISVVNWGDEGNEIKSFVDKKGKVRSRPQNESFYFHSGLAWTKSAWIRKDPRIDVGLLPAGTIFTAKRMGIFLDRNETEIFGLCAFLHSMLAAALVGIINPSGRNREAGHIAPLPILTDIFVNALLSQLACEAYDLLREWATGDEVSTQFIKPWILHVLNGFNSVKKPITQHPLAEQFEWSDWASVREIRSIRGSLDITLQGLAELCVERQKLLEKRLEEIQKEIDKEVYQIYNITDEDRALIEKEFDFYQENEASQVNFISLEKHIQRLLSYYVKKAIESDEDGIVPFDVMFPDNLLKKVRELIANDFGADQVERIEIEIRQMLGKSLKEWLAQDYFELHVSLYRRRPVFWQLASYKLGRCKNPGAFSCLIHYHKLTRDTIPKIQAHYFVPTRDSIQREKDRLQRELESAKKADDKRRVRRLSKEYENAMDNLEELEAFNTALTKVHNPRKKKTNLDKKTKWVNRAIAEIRDNGWHPIIDYGVRVNIEPLKEAMLLAKAADKVK